MKKPFLKSLMNIATIAVATVIVIGASSAIPAPQYKLEIDTDVLYQWQDLIPTYEEQITRIDGLHMPYDHFRDATDAPAYDYSKLQKEKLGRGVVAIRENQSEVVVSWRYLSSDPVNTSFNLYRDGKKVAEVPATTGTFYRDTYKSKKAATYTIKPVVNGAETGHIEGSYTLPANAPIGYINIPLDPPTDGITPAGQKYTYIPNDASIGDVDGNG